MMELSRLSIEVDDNLTTTHLNNSEHAERP